MKTTQILFRRAFWSALLCAFLSPFAAYALQPPLILSCCHEYKMTQGRMVRASLGARLQLITPKKPGTRAPGARIMKVAPKGPAAKAGLKVGDILLAVDKTTFRDYYHAKETLRYQDPSKPHTLTVQRQGKTSKVKVTLDKVTDYYVIPRFKYSCKGKKVTPTFCKNKREAFKRTFQRRWRHKLRHKLRKRPSPRKK